MQRYLGLLILFLSLALTHSAVADDEAFRLTSACAVMSVDSGTGLAYTSTGVKASGYNRVLRSQINVPDGECLSYLELAGSTTSPGGPIFGSLYVLRSGQQTATKVAAVAVPEGKSGVYKVQFPEVCLEQGDAPYIVIALNAGGGVPYETASCSYLAVGR